MTLPGSSIRWRIALVVMLLLLVASAGSIVMTDTMVSSTLRTDQEEKHLSIARGLASTLISPLLTDNHVRVRSLLTAMRARETDVAYAFVTGPDGRLIAQTPEDPLSDEVLTANPVRADATVSILPLDTEAGRINDIAVPLLNGAAGELHIGVGLRRLDLELARMRFIYVSTALLASLAGFAAAFILSAGIARPLEELAACAEEVGNGNLEVEIEDPGGRDEAARLARGFSRMIEELRRTQNEIEEKNATLAFRNLILTTQQENAPDGILVFDRTGRVISHNRRFTDIWRTSRQDLTGMGDRDVLQELVAALEDPDQLLGLGISFYREHLDASRQRLVTREGRIIECYSSPMRGPYGTVYGRVIYSRDITEQHLAEEATAREKELLEVTLASIGDGVICTDLDGRVTMMNRVAAELTGTDRKEAEGRHLSEVFRIVDAQTRLPAGDPVEDAIAGRCRPPGRAVVLVSAGGREHRVADSSSPIRAGDGAVIGVVVVFRDITMQQKMEEEMAINEKLRAIGTLAGGIAHDFNNILTAVSGNLSILRGLVGSVPGAAGKIGRMEQAVRRGKGLARQLITFASGGAPAINPGDIGAVIRESCALVTPGSRTVCRIEVAEDTRPCLMDPDQMSQAIANLVINAVQAMPDGGEVVVAAGNLRIGDDDPALAAGDYVQVSVSDQGHGIDPEILPRIFDPYFTTKENGSGLGLASCHAIVKNHGGRITVESDPGRGTVFRLLIPAADATAGPETDPDPDDMPGGNGRILVVDDEESIREVLEELLESMGYQVAVCADGGQAMALLDRGERFDAAILDLTIPGGPGGRELCGMIRERLPGLPVVASSGYSDDPVMARPEDFGFEATLAKPFTGPEVARVLAGVMSSAGG